VAQGGLVVVVGGPAADAQSRREWPAWTYTGDVARPLIAAARHEQSWGRAWHVPPTSDMPVRELEELGRADSIMAELPEMLYLYDRPNLVDAFLTRRMLGLTPTPTDDVLKEMAAGASA
ncbi:hypothetical protein JYK22_23175, partial [Nonomuraea sp. RK-328]|nr:hypothetical protein [Nonomuraea sp. RK-328]